jgi:tellurite resistance protein TerC
MEVTTVASPSLWLGFAAIVVVMLAVDLGIFHRKAHEVRPREALLWTGIWVALALLFNGFVWWRLGARAGEEFLTGYALEKALSVDNLFVIYAVFTAFAVPAQHQHRILFWGIVGAILMRAVMVFAGTSLLATFHWLFFVFGGFLVFTGLKMLVRKDERPHPENSRLLRLLRRAVPVTDAIHGGKMIVRVGGKVAVTPLLLALFVIEASDAVFAIDSIFAILAVTLDPFIVLTSNIFAILGLRSLYFVLAGAAQRFRYIQPGLALVLVFVGVKMAISEFVKIPVLISLAVIIVLVGGSLLASVVSNRHARSARATGGE